MTTVYFGSSGNDVKILQSVLNRIGYSTGGVDGYFGLNTRQAVLQYQRDNGITPDGVVGPVTWGTLERFLLGYSGYTVQPGDTFYSISRKFYTNLNAILTANPEIDPYKLMVGTRIVVPYGIDVVMTDVGYTYDLMERHINGLRARYPFLEVGTTGRSVLGRSLYYLRLGTGPTEIFYNATHHSLEWINSPVMMKFAENFLKAYSTNSSIRGYNVRDLWRRCSIYIVPMVNPDGVDIVLNGITPQNPYYNSILRWNNTGRPLSSVWNANIRGVDLNRNYPANWEEAKAQEPSLGIYGPGPTRYGGPAPLSEPETQAMVNFTRSHNFRMVLAYHTQGRVIYWKYLDMNPTNSLQYANTFAGITGYKVDETPYEAAYAGYKDWFIKEYNRPGYTFETGIGVNPLPITQFNQIYNENEEVLLLAPII